MKTSQDINQGSPVDTVKQSIDAAASAATTLPPAVSAAPPVAVTTLSLLGYTLDVWIQILTVVWLLMLISGWLWDRFVKRRRDKEQENGNT